MEVAAIGAALATVAAGTSRRREQRLAFQQPLEQYRQNVPYSSYSYPIMYHWAPTYPRNLLAESTHQYDASRRRLREVYVWNLQELQRLHSGQPQKTQGIKDAEFRRLYEYYVQRVREVYDRHREGVRQLYGEDLLVWVQPELLIHSPRS